MSEDDFEQFRQMVLQQKNLQEKLSVISDKEEFYKSVMELGRENGFDFTIENIREALMKNQRAWIERWI